MTVTTTAEGHTVTLRGAQYDRASDTLDLTKVRLSVAQVFAAVMILLSAAGAFSVIAYQVNELRREMALARIEAKEVREVLQVMKVTQGRLEERIGAKGATP